jgi:hypothetical protein
MDISHDQVNKLLRIGRGPSGHPLIREFVYDWMAKRIEKAGKEWAKKNSSRLKREMSDKYWHMADRAKEMGLPDLTYTFARGRNIGGLLGFLAGNKPVRKMRDELPDVESQPKPPKPKREWPFYSSSDPPTRGIIRRALWKKPK